MKLTKEDIDTIAKFTALLVTKIFIKDEPTIDKGSTDTKIEKPAVYKPVKEKKKLKGAYGITIHSSKNTI